MLTLSSRWLNHSLQINKFALNFRRGTTVYLGGGGEGSWKWITWAEISEYKICTKVKINFYATKPWKKLSMRSNRWKYLINRKKILLTPSSRIFKSHSLIIACLQYKTLRSCPDTIKIRILYTTIWSMIMLVSSRDGPAIGDQTRTCILFTIFRCYIAFNTVSVVVYFKNC